MLLYRFNFLYIDEDDSDEYHNCNKEQTNHYFGFCNKIHYGRAAMFWDDDQTSKGTSILHSSESYYFRRAYTF
jgi:hypothetical protein